MQDVNKGNIENIDIEDEMRTSYLEYSMSVITGRALPDARDGLKPVHRRTLYAMSELGNTWNKPYKKSARIVGDVIGKYHPHGDTAVYDTIVRMVQPFSLRYPLVDGQGNFGSIDGDNAAAMRYTEIRMERITESILADLDKDTVDWVPNYDGSEMIPDVLPTRIPNLLVNGSSGIAVGMATNIPPHNLKEVISGCVALIDNPEITVPELMEYIPGPDFPTGGEIHGYNGIVDGYNSGRGRVIMRGKHHVEDVDGSSGRQQIVITELPYQVNKANLIIKIAELVKDKKIEGISNLRDESDKDGIRVVIELKRGEIPDVVVNHLYLQTQLQTTFGMNMMALVDGMPKMLDLKLALNVFLQHRRSVVTRRSVYELEKLRERGHLLEGLVVALSCIDKAIEIIRNSSSSAIAEGVLTSFKWHSPWAQQMVGESKGICKPKDIFLQGMGLQEDGTYLLSSEQAKAILEMKLHRLTGLEQTKLIDEYKAILTSMAELQDILTFSDKLIQVVRNELLLISFDNDDARRTQIFAGGAGLTDADLIPEEDRVVTVSHLGYAKSQSLSDYQAQRRGGKGKSATGVKDEDYVTQLLVTSSHSKLLMFSSIGKVYGLRAFEIPEASRTARGRPLNNILPLAAGERITTILPVEKFEEGYFVFMAMASATVKKVPLTQFAAIRSSGLIAASLEEGDHLVSAAVTTGNCEIMLFSDNGRATRFKEYDVREMGRTARGVRGMRLIEGDKLISMIIPEAGSQILTASENGYGKRTRVEDFPKYNRGGAGVIAQGASERNGRLVAAVQVRNGEEVMLISDQGTLVRTRVDEIRDQSRNTVGVSLIRLQNEEKLVGVESIQEKDEDDDSQAIQTLEPANAIADNGSGDVQPGAGGDGQVLPGQEEEAAQQHDIEGSGSVPEPDGSGA